MRFIEQTWHSQQSDCKTFLMKCRRFPGRENSCRSGEFCGDVSGVKENPVMVNESLLQWLVCA